jgi:hypothetical protein
VQHYELVTDGGIRFVKSSAAYIDVYFGAHCSDCIHIFDYIAGETLVDSEEAFHAVVNDYLADPENDLEAHWDAAFRATVNGGMAR